MESAQLIGGRRWRRQDQHLLEMAFCLAAIGAGIVLFCINPAESNFYPRCPFHLLTGFYCPGCGSLRACHQMLHGHFAVAFGLNPLLVLFGPFLAYAATRYMLKAGGLTPPPAIRISPKMIRLLPALILVYWVARNIPASPFSWLAP